MKYEGVEITAIRVAAISWESLADHELASAFLAATFGGKPRIPEANNAYKRARELALIAEDGSMHELVFEGLKLAAGRLE